jgi:hypothetical protein
VHARGSAERSLSDADLEEKLTASARIGGISADVHALIEAVWALDQARTSPR